MNRLILVLAAGLGCTACAASVEDAPEAEQVEPQRAPPRTPFFTPYEDPSDDLVGTVDDVRLDLTVPVQTPPRFPDPDPSAAQ